MARVIQTPAARDDLREISRYIARESGSREVALRFIDAITSHCESIAMHPQLGERCDELGADVRRLTFSSYVLFFQRTKDGIHLLRVLHGARDLKRAWKRKKK
jgi:toxin ParE1/3/4